MKIIKPFFLSYLIKILLFLFFASSAYAVCPTENGVGTTNLTGVTISENCSYIGDVIVSGGNLTLDGNISLTVNGLLDLNSGTIIINSSAGTSNSVVTINAGDFTIDGTSSIDGIGKGYLGGGGPPDPNRKPGYGPGRGGRWEQFYGGGGAGYGANGEDGTTYSSYPYGAVSQGGGIYGDGTQPLFMGSGGGAGAAGYDSNNKPGRAGGAAVKINVTGTFDISGNVLMNGEDGIGYYGLGGRGTGAGAGGSIYVVTKDFNVTGSNRFQAKGGAASTGSYIGEGGGGAGGRIAFYITGTVTGFTGYNTIATVKGYGASTGDNCGGSGVGSIYVKTGTSPGIFIGGTVTYNTPQNFTNLTVNCSAVFTFNNSITIANTLIIDSAKLVINGNSPLTAGTIVVRDNGILEINGSGISTITATTIDLQNSGQIIINPGGTITNNSPTHYVAINTLDLTIDGTSSIDGTGKGYSGGTLSQKTGYGPGKGGAWNTKYGGGGAGYGNVGEDGKPVSNNGGAAYGEADATRPLYMGSGGGAGRTGYTPVNTNGGSGGAAVKVNVTGTLTIAGIIKMNGKDGTTTGGVYGGGGGGGAGGSIYIDAFNLDVTRDVKNTGPAFQSVNGSGGTGYKGDGGGGSGGRVAIYTSGTVTVPSIAGFDPTNSDDVKYLSSVQGWGGAGQNGCSGQGAGTIYFSPPAGPGYFIGGKITYASPMTYNNLTVNCNGEYTFLSDLTVTNLLSINTAKVIIKGNTNVVTAGTIDVKNGTIEVKPGGAVTDNSPNYFITINAGDLTIDANSSIEGDGQGYLGGTLSQKTGYGPGKGGAWNTKYGGGGAGYGNDGEDGKPTSTNGGAAYGEPDARQPLYMGSGGGSGSTGYTPVNTNGGSGGAAVKVNVTGTLTLAGIVQMNGTDGPSIGGAMGRGAGGGSGGSIYIDAFNLDVTRDVINTGPAFLATGGTGGTGYNGDGGGGAGGRIAIYTSGTVTVPSIAGFDPANSDHVKNLSSVQGWGGAGQNGCSGPGAGTIYFSPPAGPGFFIGGKMTFASPMAYINLTVNCNAEYTFLNDLTVTNLLTIDGAKVIMKGSTNVLTAGTVDVKNGTIEVNPGGSVTDNSPNHFITITAGDLTIDVNSSIDGTGKGYFGGGPSRNAGYGPGGGGRWQQYYGGGGAGYGGNGQAGIRNSTGVFTKNGGVIYGKGDASQPIYMGSGGGAGSSGYDNDNTNGGAGGAAVKINVTGTFAIAGKIYMNGTDGTSTGIGVGSRGAGAGAGGSIYISTNNLDITGTNRFQAVGGIGGTGYNIDGGAGAGGRIAIYSNSVTTNGIPGYVFNDDFHVHSGNFIGAGNDLCFEREEGSIYVEDRSGITYLYNGKFNFSGTKNYFDLNLLCADFIASPTAAYFSLNVLNRLTINKFSSVVSSGKGFSQGAGSGEGGYSTSGGGGGASFAGMGNSGVGANAGAAGSPYGQPIYSVLDLTLGSRGGDGSNGAKGGEGGGAVYLKIDTLILDGAITASGNPGSLDATRSYTGGGGSGGSIYIDAGDIFTSGGMVSAIGGRSFPAPNRGGTGGGGRIAVKASRSTNNFTETNLKCSNGECYVIPVVQSLLSVPQASRNSIVTLQLTGIGFMNNSRLLFFDSPSGSDISNHILYVNINQTGSSAYTADIYIRPTLSVNTVYSRLISPKGGRSQEIQSFSVLSGASGLPPVTNLSAQVVSSSQVNLSWAPSINTGVLGYYVRYATSPITAVNWSSATPVINNLTRQSTGITVTGLLPSTNYYFGVVAYDANTPATDSVIAATSSATTTNPDTPPGQITDLTAQTISSNFAELTWTAPGEDNTNPPGTKASSYDLRQEMGTTLMWASATPLSTPAPGMQGTREMFTVNGLLDSTNYCFAITSQDQNANIAPVSNTLCVTTALPGDVTPPADITDLSVIDNTWNKTTNGAEVTITWTAVGDDGMNGNAASYELYISKKVILESSLGDITYDAAGEVDLDTVSVIPFTSGGSTYPCGQKNIFLPKPDIPGSSQCYTLALYDKDNNGIIDVSETLDSNTAYYLVLHAIDDGGNYSRSNLLKVRTALIQTARTDAWQDIYMTPPAEAQTAIGSSFTVTNTWQWNMISAAKRPMGSFFGFPIPITVGNLFYPAIINNSQLSVWKWNSTVTGIIDPVTETFTGNWASPLQNNAQTGDGYYVLAPQAYHTINENAVPGSDEINPSVTIPLTKGWNIIGNPYRYLYDTSGQPITDRSGNAYEGSVQMDGVIASTLGVTVIYSGVEYDFTTAANMQNAGGVNIIGNTIYTWNGYGWEAKGYDNSFNDGARLSPWKGYWILANDNNLQLKIYKPVK